MKRTKSPKINHFCRGFKGLEKNWSIKTNCFLKIAGIFLLLEKKNKNILQYCSRLFFKRGGGEAEINTIERGMVHIYSNHFCRSSSFGSKEFSTLSLDGTHNFQLFLSTDQQLFVLIQETSSFVQRTISYAGIVLRKQ